MVDEKFVADGPERARDAYKVEVTKEVEEKYRALFSPQLPSYLQIYYEVKMWFEIQRRLWKYSSPHNSYLKVS